jgi:hypothetical protein
MFAKLPQKLTAPFGLLTDEAKLAFRSRPEGISKLISTRVRPTLAAGPVNPANAFTMAVEYL